MISKAKRGRDTTTKERLIDASSRVQPERAYLVAVEQAESESLWSVEDSLSELGILARTAGAQVVGNMIQRLRHPDVATYIGKGRVQELSDLKKTLGFNLVIVDDELSPSRRRHWENSTLPRVLDRTPLTWITFP